MIFSDILRELDVTVVITSKRSNKLVKLSADDTMELVDYKFRNVIQKFGGIIPGAKKSFWVSGISNVFRFGDMSSDPLDVTNVSRGSSDIHNFTYHDDQLLIAATGKNAILKNTSMVHDVFWSPTNTIQADTHHINGVESFRGTVYVTGLSNIKNWKAWRSHLGEGFLLNTNTGEEFNLPIPHSPKVRGDKMYILESAKSQLMEYDGENIRLVFAGFPGFVRGLDFAGKYAFVATSEYREKSTFTELSKDIAEEYGSSCAITVLDLETKEIVATHNFEDIQEIYDLAIIK